MHINHYIRWILFLAIFYGAAHSVAAQQQQNSLLWKISGNGLQQPSYVYGTMHLIEKESFFVRKEIDSVFSLSDMIAFEVDMDDTSLLAKMQNWMTLPEGTSLQDLCTEEEFNKIRTFVRDSMQSEIILYNYYKPFVLYEQMQMQTGKEIESFELYFLTKATEQSKPVTGLESVEAQLHLIDTFSYAEQISWILEQIDVTAGSDSLTERLLQAYIAEDLDAILQSIYTQKVEPMVRDHIDLFVDARNKNWIPEIKKIITGNSAFIAVGAGHLPGPNGLIRLLQQEGYTVEPL